MKAARISPFAHDYRSTGEQSVVINEKIDDIVKLIPDLLRKNLKRFRGIEAFYKVEVEHSLKNSNMKEDTRQIINIELLKKGETPQINYLYLE